MKIQFYKLAIGARFECDGRNYTKTAMSMTQSENNVGTIFPAGTEVTPNWRTSPFAS
jgi:hypothetical protein